MAGDVPARHTGTNGTAPRSRRPRRALAARIQTPERPRRPHLIEPPRRIPPDEAKARMAALDALGHELTDEELRELSETRPGTPPWPPHDH